MPTNHKTILLCEDSEEIIESTSILLTDDGYQVESLTNTKDIENKIVKIGPDLILMDLKLPTLGGEAVVPKLKMNKLTKDIPVILFTADSSAKDKVAKLGAEDYLEKPFEYKDLQKLLKKYL